MGRSQDFIDGWNKIRDGEVTLGSNLKILGAKKVEPGDQIQLKLEMKHQAKRESVWKTPPSVKLDVSATEQALWVSGDPSIATVYKGKVTAHKKGNTNIVVRYYNRQDSIKIKVQ